VRLDSSDARYRAGIDAFEHERWAESRADLREFLDTSCIPEATPLHDPEASVGCQKALWATMLGDLMTGRPDLALVDQSLHEDVGAERPELTPTIASMHERAAREMTASWATHERPARIEVVHRDETAAKYRPVEVSYSIDLREAIAIPLGQWMSEDVVVSLPAPAGQHVLELRSVYESGPETRVPYRFTVRSANAFSTTSGETTHLVVTTRERPGAPAGASAASRIVVECHALPATTPPPR
jgi:hypothetical protein